MGLDAEKRGLRRCLLIVGCFQLWSSGRLDEMEVDGG